MSKFVEALGKNDTVTENGAVSNSTTKNHLLDDFFYMSNYQGRDLDDVFTDMGKILSVDKKLALKSIFYGRAITRKLNNVDGNENLMVKGQGIKDEFQKRIAYLAKFEPDLLYKNLWLIPVVGSWKDLVSDNLIEVLDREKVLELFSVGLQNEKDVDLIKKYLPRFSSRSNVEYCKYPIVRDGVKTKVKKHRGKESKKRLKVLNSFVLDFCQYFKIDVKQYSRLKSSGKAHDFQKLITERKFDDLDFNKISSRFLNRLVKSRAKFTNDTFLQRHDLEGKFLKFIESKGEISFKGYVHELVHDLRKKDYRNLDLITKVTTDKQFESLISLAKEGQKGIFGNVWTALDTSGSMGGQYPNMPKDVTPFDICIGLGIFFSTLNEGSFKDNVIMFDNVSQVKQLTGSFTDKYKQIMSTKTAWGSTNFQSVIDEICRIRKTKPNIPVEDFPQTLIVVSDMQFNPSGDDKTNYETAMRKLAYYGLPKINIIWWNLNTRSNDFPSTIDDEGTTLISGYDGSIISLLLSGEQEKVDEVTKEVRRLTPYEQMLKALDQEVLNMIEV